MSAFFGPPGQSFIRGGAHIAVYLVPVHENRLIVFDVEAAEARGRWLPWDVLPWQGNPYETASELADLWCQVPLNDLALADVMSFPSPEDAWEIAIIFRADLAEPPPGDAVRTPYAYPPGEFDAIGPFDPIDLERWVTGGVANRTVIEEPRPPEEDPGMDAQEPSGEPGDRPPKPPLLF